jgi:hypothetical protein
MTSVGGGAALPAEGGPDTIAPRPAGAAVFGHSRHP